MEYSLIVNLLFFVLIVQLKHEGENIKAIDCIEPAPVYYVLSNDRHTKPMYVGDRKQLTKVLKDVKDTMVIMTTGNDTKCLVLMDYTNEELLILVTRATETKKRVN